MVKQDDVEVSLLKELEPLNQLFIKQTSVFNYMPFIRQRANKYRVETSAKDLVFTIEEDKSWWSSYICYRLRPCQLRMYNRNGFEVIRINRPFAVTSRVLPCQLQVLIQPSQMRPEDLDIPTYESRATGRLLLLARRRQGRHIQHLAVFSPPTKLIGTIEQQWSSVRPLYKARDHNGLDTLFVRGPLLTVSNILSDVEFPVSDCSGARAAVVHKISKGIEGVLFPPYPQRYSVTFTSPSMSVENKAMLVAMTLLLHYMYYD